MVVSEIINLFQRKNIILNKTRLDIINALCQQVAPIGAIELAHYP